MTQATIDLRERLRFAQIDDATRSELRAVLPFVERNLDSVLTDFYAMIRTWPHLVGMFSRPGAMDHAKQEQKKHWQRLFSAQFDAAYIESARKIGLAHVVIGLQPSWYIGAYNFVLNKLLGLVVQEFRRKPDRIISIMAAINKAVLLDMDVVVEAYDLERERRARQERLGLAKAFDDSVVSVVTALENSAQAVKRQAEELSKVTGRTTQEAMAVSSASEQASSNVQSVASAAEQLSASIAEISRQVGTSSGVARDAVGQIAATNSTVEGLARAAEKIGEVVKLINDIAGQTNLLALNATIEAARAGEAGKGFAVVAQEVKNLANQTAKATDEIGQQVGAIQSTTAQAVQAMRGVGQIMDRISGITSDISDAVHQQHLAATEIARNVEQASSATIAVSNSIVQVNEAARSTGQSAEMLLNTASTLQQQGGALRAESQQFMQKLAGN